MNHLSAEAATARLRAALAKPDADQFDFLPTAIITGTPRADVLVGTGGNDTIRGGSGNDRIDGGYGNDTLYGGKGADLLIGGPGRNTLDGGPGKDKAYLGAPGTTVDNVYNVERFAGGWEYTNPADRFDGRGIVHVAKGADVFGYGIWRDDGLTRLHIDLWDDRKFTVLKNEGGQLKITTPYGTDANFLFKGDTSPLTAQQIDDFLI